MYQKAIYFFIGLSLCSAQVAADFDSRWHKNNVLGRHLQVIAGEGPTPIKTQLSPTTVPLQMGEPRDLAKYFNYRENLSAVVLSNGELVYQRYNPDLGIGPLSLTPGMSMTKTVTGLLVGHLLCEGKIRDLDEKLGFYSKALANSIYSEVTIRNLLRMASGVNGDRSNEQAINRRLRNRHQDGTNDQVALIQALNKKYSEQGIVSRYHTLDATAAAILIEELAAQPLDQYFNEKIFSTLGAEEKLVWWADKHGNPLGFGGLNMITRDWARLGQYIVDELQAQTCLGNFLQDGITQALDTTERETQRYGYFFWVSEIGGKPVMVLTGKGGQAMIPNHYNNSVVLVISASDFKYKNRSLLGDILPAVSRQIGQ
jgi:CubicO group peptidase (beta-lactamase class C family)